MTRRVTLQVISVMVALWSLSATAYPAGVRHGSTGVRHLRLAWTTTLPVYRGAGPDPAAEPGPAAGGRVVILSGHRTYFTELISTDIFVVDLATGKVLWSGAIPSYPVLQMDESRLYVRSPSGKDPSRIYSFNAVSGKVERLSIEPAYSLYNYGVLLAHGDRVLYVSDDGSVVAVDAQSLKKIIWRLRPEDVHLPARGAPAARELRLVAIAEGRVYIKTHSEQVIAVVRMDSGIVERITLFGPMDAFNQLMSLVWSPRHKLFFASVGTIGAGVQSLSLWAARSDLSRVWSRPNTEGFSLVSGVLICGDLTKPYVRRGVVGLDPVTGRELWKRSLNPQSETEMIGELAGSAIMTISETAKGGTTRRIVGIRPRDGAEVWSMPVPNGAGARVYGKWLVVTYPGQDGRRFTSVRAYKWR